jgi:hypothetical protein
MAGRIIGVDIDGVLANFNKGYRQKLIEVTGRDLIPEEVCRGSRPGEEPPCWNYAPHFGYTREEDRATWEAIAGDRGFWQGLDVLPGASALLISLKQTELDQDAEIYFITSRPGNTAKEQTEWWLMQHGFRGATVMIARGEKGFFAHGLGLTHFLDDKPENCESVKIARPGTHNYLLSCRYNESAHDRLKAQGVIVVNSLHEFAALALWARTH